MKALQAALRLQQRRLGLLAIGDVEHADADAGDRVAALAHGNVVALEPVLGAALIEDGAFDHDHFAVAGASKVVLEARRGVPLGTAS